MDFVIQTWEADKGIIKKVAINNQVFPVRNNVGSEKSALLIAKEFIETFEVESCFFDRKNPEIERNAPEIAPAPEKKEPLKVAALGGEKIEDYKKQLEEYRERQELRKRAGVKTGNRRTAYPIETGAYLEKINSTAIWENHLKFIVKKIENQGGTFDTSGIINILLEVYPEVKPATRKSKAVAYIKYFKDQNLVTEERIGRRKLFHLKNNEGEKEKPERRSRYGSIRR